MISLLIPAFNEKEAITETIVKAHDVFSGMGEEFEILIINDGSTDGTQKILSNVNMPNVHILNHSQNKGYGASMKTGIRRAKGDLIAITDADGTYPIVDFPKLLSTLKEKDADMVVGARTKKGVQIPLIRRPAKAVINVLVNSLSGRKIPDNNSGMRIFKKSIAEEFMHLYPQGFSFTITITLAAITSDYNVIYVPIDYFKRQGTSSMSSGLNGIKHFLNFIGLIIRITTYFRPLKFFVWPATLLFLGGIAYIGYTVKMESNVSDAGMLMILTGIQIGLFGILAEVVVRQGRAKKS
ncbi:MAG: glycosyltransferase family 2 protein [bacterium]|nr:glycosyltransferase family 2 protein [bacterium]MDA1292348.1 glycosyltransferase family 2 protein [bacterium]